MAPAAVSGKRSRAVHLTPAPAPARWPRGFTLIEVLVVIVIVSIIVSFAMLSIGGREGEREAREARALAARLQAARELALFNGEDLGLLFEERGYRFLVHQGGRWTDAPQDSPLRARRLPDDMELELYLEGIRADFDPNVEKLLPQAVILSSGETTPFEVVISDGRRPDALLTVDALGNAEIEVES